ncbi:cupin domain-containing protein [Variovorax humicola]|uniref:Cupin domain-containing protein n=1 Tax=Variovorax humicola TaxID=1769758 RepID=A0ABU8W9M9_9BURK
MSSVFNERLSGRLAPTPGGSVYVDPAQLAWQPSQFPGIQMKVLYRDDAVGEMTVLLKWEPGAVLPFHKHPEIEQSYVLEGSFYDHDGICAPGSSSTACQARCTKPVPTKAACCWPSIASPTSSSRARASSQPDA